MNFKEIKSHIQAFEEIAETYGFAMNPEPVEESGVRTDLYFKFKPHMKGPEVNPNEEGVLKVCIWNSLSLNEARKEVAIMLLQYRSGILDHYLHKDEEMWDGISKPSKELLV